MERFLDYENIYLLSMDLNAYGRFRTRMWKIDITKHLVLRERYIEWMNKLGYPKFNTTSDQPSVNFQLFLLIVAQKNLLQDMEMVAQMVLAN